MFLPLTFLSVSYVRDPSLEKNKRINSGQGYFGMNFKSFSSIQEYSDA